MAFRNLHHIPPFTAGFLIEYARECWQRGMNPARLLLDLRDLFPCSGLLVSTFKPILIAAGVVTLDKHGDMRINRVICPYPERLLKRGTP